MADAIAEIIFNTDLVSRLAVRLNIDHTFNVQGRIHAADSGHRSLAGRNQKTNGSVTVTTRLNLRFLTDYQPDRFADDVNAKSEPHDLRDKTARKPTRRRVDPCDNPGKNSKIDEQDREQDQHEHEGDLLVPDRRGYHHFRRIQYRWKANRMRQDCPRERQGEDDIPGDEQGRPEVVE